MNLFDVYPLFNINLVKGEGSHVWDDKGEKYLDFYGGHAVISIGHSHPHYVKSITQQLHKIGFYSNSVIITLQQELANKLGALSGYHNYNLFLCNSGAEANENAFKLASFHTGKKKIISFTKSFHGRTSAAVAATDDKTIIAPINETNNFILGEWNNEDALETIFKENDIAAVIIEGVQGVGGINVPSTCFLQKIRALCHAFNALLICDEIQSGYGRTGKFFAHQFANIEADLITVAKGMGNGFPIAGVLIHPNIKAKHGLLGTTFGGNYLACTAAIAVLDVIEKENLIDNATQLGNYLITALQKNEGIKEVRGMGLMIGIELHTPSTPLRNQLLDEFHIFTGSSSNKNTIRILPPLTITKNEVDEFLQAFTLVMQNQMIHSS